MMKNKSKQKLNQKELPETIELTEQSSEQILKFLSGKKQDGDILLAYFQDGVLWGKVIDDKLICSTKFNDKAFLRAHLFNETRELRVIQTPDGLKIFESIEQDGDEEENFSFDRNYLLWGDKLANPQPEGCPEGFTWVDMGQRGIRQCLPFSESELVEKDEEIHRVNLKVRYYANASQRGEDEANRYKGDEGNYHIYARRLLGLSIGGK
jgi:CRISPR-associated protein (TIGR03984 family)